MTNHEIARNAAASPLWVNQQTELVRAAEQWLTRSVIGLDTEFVRERTYFARPGLVQISDGESVWLIDPLALEDLRPLGDLLANPDITKVLHSVGEDLEVLEQLTGKLPDPLGDTQVAAAMLGFPLQLRYETLVEEILGEVLEGGKARSDWTRRPLADALLGYAAQDVAWLPALWHALSNKLDNAGRMDWVREDCQRMLSMAGEPVSSDQAYLRIKGAGRLEDHQLGRLKELAAWREDEARARDLPRGFVIKDDLMLKLAREAPRNEAGLAEIQGLPRPVVRRHGTDILRILALSPDTEFQRPAILAPMNQAQKDELTGLQARVKSLAEELGIEPAVIASKRNLTRFVLTGEARWMDGWRKALLVPSGP